MDDWCMDTCIGQLSSDASLAAQTQVHMLQAKAVGICRYMFVLAETAKHTRCSSDPMSMTSDLAGGP